MTEKQREKMNARAKAISETTCDETVAYKFGYTTAHNDATAIIERLEKALTKFTDWAPVGEIKSMTSSSDVVEFNYATVLSAREALAELNKWRDQ